MDYHLAADILSKFQSAPEGIQALWLILTATLLITPFASFLLALRVWPKRSLPAIPTLREPEPTLRPLGEILYGVVRAPDGRWYAYLDGIPKELAEEDRNWIEARKRESEDGESGGGGVMH